MGRKATRGVRRAPRRLKDSPPDADYTEYSSRSLPSPATASVVSDRPVLLNTSAALRRAAVPVPAGQNPQMPPFSSPTTASPARHPSGRAALGSEAGLTLIEVLVT